MTRFLPALSSRQCCSQHVYTSFKQREYAQDHLVTMTRQFWSHSHPVGAGGRPRLLSIGTLLGDGYNEPSGVPRDVKPSSHLQRTQDR